MRIFVTGDTHCTHDIDKLLPHKASTQITNYEKITKDDYMIIAGDAGIIWHDKNSPLTKDVISLYESFPWTTLFIDGNHENHKELATFPAEELNGGKVHKISDSIIHLMRGQIFTFNDKTIFTMGGADSIDKMWRVEDESWWPEEMPSDDEYDEAINNLTKANMKTDYIITHCSPTFYLRRLCTIDPRPDRLTNFFERLEMVEKVEFKKWFFGHYHIDLELDATHRCLYDDIIEL